MAFEAIPQYLYLEFYAFLNESSYYQIVKNVESGFLTLLVSF